MTIERHRFRQGELFEWRVEIGGVIVELLAEIEILGATLHLRDVAIYPTGTGRASVGAGPLLRAARREVLPVVRVAGFHRLRITGNRLSGATPGRRVDFVIELSREAP